MEHRWSQRRAMQGEVMLVVGGRRPAPVTVSDLSVGGLGVTGTDLNLPADSFVTVSFSIAQPQSVSHHRVLAQVVHSRARAAGLLFVDPGRETLQALRALLTQTVSGRVGVRAFPVPPGSSAIAASATSATSYR